MADKTSITFRTPHRQIVIEQIRDYGKSVGSTGHWYRIEQIRIADNGNTKRQSLIRWDVYIIGDAHKGEKSDKTHLIGIRPQLYKEDYSH